MKKKNDSSVSNVKIAIVFFAFLAFIAGVSLIFKAVDVIRMSRFDDSRRFTLSISNNRNIEVMSLSPSSKEIVIFKINGNLSPAEVGRILEIPIDGFIASESLDLGQKVNSLFMNAILKYGSFNTNLTIVDLVKLTMLTKTIPQNTISTKTIGNIGGMDTDKTVGRSVSDNLVEKDKQTIQIINATGVSGLGNRLARLVTNMGGNVILVATENNLRKNSKISYFDKKTYTVEKLQKVLGYEAVKEVDNAISDITIIIGEDKVNKLPF